MISQFISGLACSLKGINIIRKPGIRRFVVIPLGINIILFAIAIAFLVTMFSQWMETLMPDFPDWLTWLEEGIRWILWPLFSIMLFFIAFYSFTFIANLIAAPFNSLLAQKVETVLRGGLIDDTSPLPTWHIIKKSLASEISKLTYILKWSVIIFIISFIPVINIIAPALWLILGAWLLALEYLDYPMSNHNLFFKELNQYAIMKKTQLFGFGFSTLALTSIPLINLVVMPASVAGATALWIQQEKEKNAG